MSKQGGGRLARQLRQRFEQLGVAAVSLEPEDRLVSEVDGDWLYQLIIQSTLFRRSMQAVKARLVREPGEAIELWPGVYVVGLALPGRRRIRRLAQQPCAAALLLTHRAAEAEQLQAIASQRQRDFKATLAHLQQVELFEDREVHRLAPVLFWMQQDRQETQRHEIELQNLSSELSESYEELSLLYKLSSNMTVDQAPRIFLHQACEQLKEVTGLRWLSLQLRDDEPRLEDLGGLMVTAGAHDQDEGQHHRLGASLFEAYGSRTEPTVLDDQQHRELSALADMRDEILVAPLCTPNRALGVLYGGDNVRGSGITSVASKLCNSLANSLAIFVENRMLYEDMHAMFLGTLHALTSAIDAKDSYTHGHTERVASLARMLAEQSGLDRETVERVYISGLVHDVGKIGVPEAVLCKPGKLTDDEFALIKMHPGIGGRILQDIRQMADLLPGVLHHHERWDGGGYPEGLSGYDIPLFGRLIGLADAFDAMISTRTYRGAMALDDVREEIRSCAGTQFDPELAEVFLNLDFQPFFELLDKHRAQKAGHSDEPELAT